MARLNLGNPVVIGGTGGSGTRLIQQIFVQSGFFMGSPVNESGDAMHFEPFLDRAINRVLEHTKSIDYAIDDLPKPLTKDLLAELSELIEAHKKLIPPNARGWGWKNPRSIYLWPLIHELYPQVHFMHMLRDGRDMALSQNQNQLRKHYASLFGQTPGTFSDSLASIAMWQKINIDAARSCKRAHCHYTLLRYEDIRADPKMLAALQKTFDLPELDYAALVKTSPLSGKYLALKPDERAALESAGSEGLRQFGYLA